MLTSQFSHVRCDHPLFPLPKKVYFVWSIYWLEHGQIPSGQPPQGRMGLSPPSTKESHLVVRAGGLSLTHSTTVPAGRVQQGLLRPHSTRASAAAGRGHTGRASSPAAQPLTWLQAAAPSLGSHMSFCGNTGRRHLPGLWLYQDR